MHKHVAGEDSVTPQLAHHRRLLSTPTTNTARRTKVPTSTSGQSGDEVGKAVRRATEAAKALSTTRAATGGNMKHAMGKLGRSGYKDVKFLHLHEGKDVTDTVKEFKVHHAGKDGDSLGGEGKLGMEGTDGVSLVGREGKLGMDVATWDELGIDDGGGVDTTDPNEDAGPGAAAETPKLKSSKAEAGAGAATATSEPKHSETDVGAETPAAEPSGAEAGAYTRPLFSST